MHLSRFRPRFTVRRLMVAVGGFAILLALVAKFPDWADHRRARCQITHDEYSWDYKILLHRDRMAPQGARVDPRVLAYYLFMRDKYERAARYPWLPVWPDPARPE